MQAKSVEGLSKIEVMGELGSGDRDRWEVGGGRENWERTRRKEHKQTKGNAVWVGPRIRPIKRVLV